MRPELQLKAGVHTFASRDGARYSRPAGSIPNPRVGYMNQSQKEEAMIDTRSNEQDSYDHQARYYSRARQSQPLDAKRTMSNMAESSSISL